MLDSPVAAVTAVQHDSGTSAVKELVFVIEMAVAVFAAVWVSV